MSYAPTPEQEAIVAAFKNGGHNAVRALAGTGKTSTLELIAEAVAVPMLSIAFNKRNATELKARMPSHCTCATMHSVGMKATGRWLGRKLTVDDNKKGTLLKAELNLLSENDKAEAWRSFGDLMDALKKAYSMGYVPGNYGGIASLVTEDEYRDGLEFEPSNLEWRLISRVLDNSIGAALGSGKIDFDDMVYLPALWPVGFTPHALTLVDESQDLSLLNHRLVTKLVGRERLGIVGDPYQAIYAFRGADETSMDHLIRQYSMNVLPLTMAFRCPRAVIEHVQWRAPDMQPTPWAKPGSIETLEEWDASVIPDGAFVICRNNAPLFRLALNLIRAGRRPEVLGNDVTKGIVKTLKKISTNARLPSDQAITAFEPEAERLRRRYKDSKTINDKIDCITYFLEDQPTLGLAIARAEQIMNQTGTISLMTGHKSKGLEADHVFFLDEHLVKDEGQDRNLRYVICTRSKDRLTYITSKGLVTL